MPENSLPNQNFQTPAEPQDASSQTVIMNEKAAPQGKSHVLKYVLFGVIAVLIITGLAAAYMFGKNSSNKTEITNSISPSPSVLPSKITIQDFPYIRDDEIFINGKQITNTNGTIYKFAYSEKNNTLAYISGVKKSVYGGTSYIEPQFIYIQKVGENPKKIFTLVPDQEPNSEYTVQIKDLAFTSDENELITTTNQVLSIWKLNGELKNQINLPEKDDTMLVYYYGDPKLSPDGNKILLRKGYYEGSSNSIVDLPTKKVTGLGNTSYVMGEYYIDWLPNNKLVSFEHGDYTSEEPIKSSVNIYSSDNIKENSFPFNKFINSYVLAGDKLYVVSSTEAGGESAIYKFESIDSKNGTVKTIAELPTLKDYYPSGILYSKSLNSIFISFRRPITDQINNKIYVLNLDKPNPVFELFQDNASFYYQ